MSEESKIKKKDQNQKIGNKLINIPKLMKNYVSLRYLNGEYVKGRNLNRPITPELKKIIIDIIEKNKYEQNDYEKLDITEKKYLDEILDFTKISIIKHQYLNENENKQDIKRFNLIKEQLLAGNDSRELLREFKLLLFKLKSKNLISTHSFNHLCCILVVLGI